MRFHVVGLPSTITNDKSPCGFTSLAANFIKMMKYLGHTVYHYGVGCDVECDEHIQIMNPVSMDWSGSAQYWPVYNQTVIDEINLRKCQGDFVCVINGWLNKSLKNIPHTLTVEYAIGYNGTFADYRVFASHSHMNKIWGAESGYDPDGKFYDTVIPHYLDATQYPLKESTSNYFVYMGRLIARKGIQIAINTCKEIGAKLLIAGNGDLEIHDSCVELVGPVYGEDKIKLLQGAIAMFAPTQYIEPFNLAVIESQMVGTPVITTDFGAFPENVIHGATGFTCRTLNDFIQSAKLVQTLDPYQIKLLTEARYDIQRVCHLYQKYFEDLMDLWGLGWSTIR